MCADMFWSYTRIEGKLSKSELVLVGVVRDLEELVTFFGWKVSYVVITKLGLPLGAVFKSSVWSGVWRGRKIHWLNGRKFICQRE